MNSLARRSFLSDPIFKDFFSDLDLDSRSTKFSFPLANIRKDKEKKIIELMAAGYSKEDFNIELDQGKLIVSAQKEKSEQDFERREFHVQKFKREFYIGQGFKEDEVKASYDAGILSIELKEKKEKKKMIQIE